MTRLIKFPKDRRRKDLHSLSDREWQLIKHLRRMNEESYERPIKLFKSILDSISRRSKRRREGKEG